MTQVVVDSTTCVTEPASSVMTDVRRAREFYRYLQPDNLIQPQLRRRSSTFDVHHDHVPSLNNALSPFCQLTALRCNVAKAMLNVMDRDVMYFLAEASCKTNSVDGKEIAEFVEDPILLSCSSVPLKGRICELTLRMDKPDDPCQIPTFVIPDLTKSQFAEMSIVAGAPHYRFYAGVPITTRDGVNIGSLAVMDTSVRPDGLTPMEEEFLGRSAEQIMTYLETNRQAIEGRRSRQLAEGLEAFISGKRSIGEEGSKQLSEKTLKRRAKTAYGISLGSDNEPAAGPNRSPKYKGAFGVNGRSNSIVSLEPEMNSSAQSTDTDEQQSRDQENDSRSHSRTFARAANLLRECFGDLGEEGSVHFLTLTTRSGSSAQKSHSINGNAVNLPRVASLTDCIEPGNGEDVLRSRVHPRVIACSKAAEPILHEEGLEVMQILDLEEDVLRSLTARYPGGHLWTLEDSAASSSEDDQRAKSISGNTPFSGRVRRSSRRKRSELIALRTAFPNARQVLFTPLWDASTGSFAHGCFITTALETRSFNSSIELPFLNSFCSTIMAECSRLDAMVADRQKSDFVGTISHEMRSPLHGILASVEFLTETDVTGFQRSLVETIDSCGRTLLDTINHVLDFSKVNSFQKQWQAANHRTTHGPRRKNHLTPDNSSRAMSHGAPPLLQLFGPTDVSVVLEEVVDGLVLGHTYINSGVDITDLSKEARGRANGQSGDQPGFKPDPVEIILSIQRGEWTFMTQPGAVRRIIMNITGNAIKYTNQGTIKVQLEQKDAPEGDTNGQVMILTVSDTGKGISPEFLSSRLFVPFAQENALAPGTGLGMSIVRSIVLMLGGTIDVKSRVGKGTTVQVTLPMKKPLPGQLSTQNTPHSGGTAGSGGSNDDDSILLLQSQAAGEMVTFYRQRPRADDPLADTVQYYVREWYGLEYVDSRLLESSSVVIVEEEDLEHLMTKATSTPGKRPALVIMCSLSSRHSSRLINSLEERLSSAIEFVARPCGPTKLARSIRQVLEKKKATSTRFPQITTLDIIPETLTPPSSMTPSSAYDTAGDELQELDLSAPGRPGPIVQANETFSASKVSHNAQMAIHDLSAGLRTPRTQMSDHDAFPFPVQPEEKSRQRREGNRGRSVSIKNEAVETTTLVTGVANAERPRGDAIEVSSVKVNPHVLLVDDNKINLKLLETFLKKKRNYAEVEKAEDGQQAVDAVIAATDPFDVIFMDISMPVMNGFEATRAIREFEEQIGASPGAMIIALTGLASGRDQSEGFDSGCDIYMTKPVSFKEVGRLLDNWESHQKANPEHELSGEMAKLNLKLSPDVKVAAEISMG